MTPDELLQQYVERYLRWIDGIEKEIARDVKEWGSRHFEDPDPEPHLAKLREQHERFCDRLDFLYEIQREMKKLRYE